MSMTRAPPRATRYHCAAVDEGRGHRREPCRVLVVWLQLLALLHARESLLAVFSMSTTRALPRATRYHCAAADKGGGNGRERAGSSSPGYIQLLEFPNFPSFEIAELRNFEFSELEREWRECCVVSAGILHLLFVSYMRRKKV